MTDIVTVTSQQISDRLLADLRKAFPAPRVNDPLLDPRKVFWEAAQHEVVLWIESKLSVRTVSGDANKLR